MPCGRGGVCVILLDGFICAHEGGSDSSMAQSILPENSTLARQIRTAAGHGALSHAVILSGEGDRAAAARYLAAAYVCRESERPCLRCAACRKVLEDIHPDVRWIADTERRELPVETLRELEELEKLSALGKSYLGALRREVRRLMLGADETLDGAVAESVTEKLGERELLELKKAFGARAAKKLGTNVQIGNPREVREENERDFCV